MRKISLPALHKHQREIFDVMTRRDAPRFALLACGARWGKDRLCLTTLLYNAINWATFERERRQAANLVPLVLCWYVAPTFALLRQAWDELTALTRAIPGVRFNRSEMRAFLPGDVQIEFKSADNPNALVSRGLDMVVITEAARMKKEAFENAIVTRLASPGRGPNGSGGIALLNSTPLGQNWFYQYWLKGQDANATNIRSWRFTSYDNPYINPAELDAHRRLLPERAFAQEYLAEFLAGGGSVFRGLQNAFKAYTYPCPGMACRGPVSIGIDWGRHNDRTALVALEFSPSGCYRLVGHRLLVNLSYEAQMRQIEAFCAQWNNPYICAECNGLGDPLVEQLSAFTRRKIIPFTTTAASKRAIIETAVLLFEQGAIELPATMRHGVMCSGAEELTNELGAFEQVTTRGGALGYSAPAGGHDDLVMAFCFALNARQELRKPRGGFLSIQ